MRLATGDTALNHPAAYRKLNPMKRILIALVAGGSVAQATERYPEKPFARMVDIPEQGQLVVTPWFTYSAFQSYWQGTHEVDLSRGDLEYDVEYYLSLIHISEPTRPY